MMIMHVMQVGMLDGAEYTPVRRSTYVHMETPPPVSQVVAALGQAAQTCPTTQAPVEPSPRAPSPTEIANSASHTREDESSDSDAEFSVAACAELEDALDNL